MIERLGWYFTAPWDPVQIRRGDALGLRASSDYFADLLAPNLSNATSDARWISLLSWCLKWSHVVWKNAGGGDLSRRDEQRARYAWLRPLELLWVARTLESGQTTGQLRGRRSIKKWQEADHAPPNFAMTPDQFRRYRQVGMYGAYRVVMRNIPGLTIGDGWTPDKTADTLANLVNESLHPCVRLKRESFDRGIQWGSWTGKDREAEFWVRRGWSTSFKEASVGYLPTPDDAVSQLLHNEERRLIEPVLFGAGSIRRVTAEVLASAKSANSHAALCDDLANSRALARVIDPALLALLPVFSRFAYAAMDAMRRLWFEINEDKMKQDPDIVSLARSIEIQARLDSASRAGADWLGSPSRIMLPHSHVVTKLAETMQVASSRGGCPGRCCKWVGAGPLDVTLRC